MMRQAPEYAQVTSEQPASVVYVSDLLQLAQGTDVEVGTPRIVFGSFPRVGKIWTFYELAGDEMDRVKLLQRVASQEIHMLAANVRKFIPSANGLLLESGFDHLIYTPHERRKSFPMLDEFLRRFGK